MISVGKRNEYKAFYNYLLLVREVRDSTATFYVQKVGVLLRLSPVLSATSLTDAFATLKANGAKGSYINKLREIARIYCDFLQHSGQEVDHGIYLIKKVKEGAITRATMSDSEIEAFLNLPPLTKGGTHLENYNRWTLFFSIMAYTGMRPQEIADYADKNGTMEKTEKGFMVEVDINSYMKHLGYTLTPDGSYKTQDRRKVWHDLKKVFNTPVKRAVNFKSGTITKTAVFEAPIIQLAEVYDGSNTKQVITYSLENINPPQSFLIGIVSEVAKQMTGFREAGLYFHKNLIVEPRSKASDYKYDLQGYKLAVRERLFYLFKLSVQDTRRYAVKDLTEVISGRDKDKRRKLIEALEVLVKRGEIRQWGFANSRNKSYNKTEKKSSLVWVDHTDTDVLRKYQDFYKGNKSDTAKLREEVKRLKKEQQQHGRAIEKMKKDL